MRTVSGTLGRLCMRPNGKKALAQTFIGRDCPDGEIIEIPASSKVDYVSKLLRIHSEFELRAAGAKLLRFVSTNCKSSSEM